MNRILSSFGMPSCMLDKKRCMHIQLLTDICGLQCLERFEFFTWGAKSFPPAGDYCYRFLHSGFGCRSCYHWGSEISSFESGEKGNEHLPISGEIYHARHYSESKGDRYHNTEFLDIIVARLFHSIPRMANLCQGSTN